MATNFAVRLYDSGVIVRPEVSYETVEHKFQEAEEARIRDKDVFESLGFSWDGEMLGWWHSGSRSEKMEAVNKALAQVGGQASYSNYANKWNAGVA